MTAPSAKAAHTALPWSIHPEMPFVIMSGFNSIIDCDGPTREEDDANAELIVRAVNNHADLLALVKRLTDSAECCVEIIPHAGFRSADSLAALCKYARAVINKIETA